MKKLSMTLMSVFAFFAPVFAFAQIQQQTGATAGSILGTINNLLNWLIPILITLAIVYFIWGVIRYVFSKEDDDKKAARSIMINGLIGLFVILSVWGLIAVIGNTFGISQGGANPNPTLQGDCTYIGGQLVC